MTKEEFKHKAKAAVTAIFHEIEEDKKDLFALAICVPNEITGFLVAYNTFSRYAHWLSSEFLDRTKNDTRGLYESNNLIITGYRWDPSWWLEVSEHELLDEANGILKNDILPQERLSAEDKDINNNLLDLLASVLIELRNEGLFVMLNKHFYIYLHEYDSGYSLKDQERIKKLIGERHFEDFLSDMKKEGLIYSF